VVPALVQPAWWPVPAVLAVVTLAALKAAPPRPQADDVDRATLERFAAAHGWPRLAPVTIVIAAYHEADGIGPVLQNLPRELLGLPVDVVVVDDGSGDGTGEAAEASGRAHVLRCPTNRGQGAALRLGYRFAREHGADYIITTDADGQYDVADMPRVLAPVVAGEADFVTGSRVIGHQETFDRVRRLGVHVFAWTVTALTGRRITDTSFGLRAMRADITADVTLDQPQYQSSELLIGMLAHGARVTEVAATMRLRGAGTTKKGTNWVYGRRYAGVVWGTWWREYVGGAARRAPALRAEERRAEPVGAR
jgi:glycosyltransferase involved in cell wall biosynthesis